MKSPSTGNDKNHTVATLNRAPYLPSWQRTNIQTVDALPYTMKTLAIAALAPLLACVSAYPITGDNVNCRSGPGTSYGVVRQYDRNQQVTLTCQTEGTNVEGNKIWDKTTDSCYVSDYYVKTGVSGYVTSKCGSSSSNSYAISGDDVNCRSGPGTSYSATRQYDKGHMVTLTCQTEGTNVEGNKIWDKTSDGCYVSDYYVKTGVDGYVTSKCSSSGGGSSGGGSSSCGAPKSNQATVDLIAEFEGFRANVCKSFPSLSPPPRVGN